MVRPSLYAIRVCFFKIFLLLFSLEVRLVELVSSFVRPVEVVLHVLLIIFDQLLCVRSPLYWTTLHARPCIVMHEPDAMGWLLLELAELYATLLLLHLVYSFAR